MDTIPFSKNKSSHRETHWQTAALLDALRRKVQADKKAAAAYAKSTIPVASVRLCHMSKLISKSGGVSPLCAEAPREVDLARETWSGRWKHVTCPTCLALQASDSSSSAPA